MISCPTVQKDVIRNHYDVTTVFYRLFWGSHIHHGLWDGMESPRQAQLNLTRTLAREAGIVQGHRVLDVGCGMGGSAIHLAKACQCHVTGITLSAFQQRWAKTSAWLARVSSATRFVCGDAESVQFSRESFDAVWSIECTEHLFDKALFFQRAAQWLSPGGRVAICAWLADDSLSPHQTQQVYQVCEGFFCPSLGTFGDYHQWLEQAGLVLQARHDWSDRVVRTWEICLRRVQRTGMPYLAQLFGPEMRLFVDRFQTILEAYRSGALRYGCLIASRLHEPAKDR